MEPREMHFFVGHTIQRNIFVGQCIILSKMSSSIMCNLVKKKGNEKTNIVKLIWIEWWTKNQQ